jgi:hypothetical protein
MATATVQEQPTQVMQGILVPASSVNPEAFFAHTRRLRFTMQPRKAYAGLGNSELVTTLQTGIIAQLSVLFVGSLTVTPGTGTVATTAHWPYGLLRGSKFVANGQSNLINAPGHWLKAREMVVRDINDRGVIQRVGGAHPGTAVQQGSLSGNQESWGVGQSVTAIPAGTYDVVLHFVVPVCYDEKTLLGAIFAQTASTELALSLDWAPQSDLFALTGNATVALSGSLAVEGIVYSIPEVGGQIVVPNLSAFHSFIVSRTPGIANGVNEPQLPGQGVGRQLMRCGFRVYNGAAPGTPLALTSNNFGQIGWRYGGNDTPEIWENGKHYAAWMERNFGTDVAAVHGLGVYDWANEFALRDSIDEGLATNLRLLVEIPSGVALSGPPVMEIMQETIFGAAAGA